MDLLERVGLLDALAQCPPGCLALVSGEAGIGKTSLVRAFCAGDTRPVLWGSCDALRTPRPLGPLRDMAAQTGGALARAMAAPRPEMFAAFLAELAGRAVIAVVEDAHWADEATLDLLVFAGRRIPATSSLLIVTYREEEVGAGHPLRGVLGMAARDRTVRRLQLPPLSPAAVAALAAPHGVDAAGLHARTGGNPFFVTEALADPGRMIPATVRDAVLARSAALTPAQRDALSWVAIFPGGAQLPVPEPEAADGCVAAGMLVADGTRIGFRHELARLAVQDAISPGRKALLHRQALDRLSAAGADPARLAYHAEEAADAAAVLEYAPAAARQAAAVGALRQAAEHYAQALRFATGRNAPDRAELLEAFAEACAGAGRAADAVTASGQALACWREAGQDERAAALLARRAHYLWGTGQNEQARESAQDALALAGRLPPGPGLAAAYTYSAYLLMLARDIPGAIQTGGQAIALAEQFGSPVLLSRALNAVGAAYWFAEPDRAEPVLTRAVQVARQAGDDAAAGSALVNLGSGAGEIRRYQVAERWLQEAIDWCSARDLQTSHRYATAWLARCLFERGEWPRASGLLASPAPGGTAPARIVELTVLGRLRARRGDPGAAEALDQAFALAAQTGDLQRLWPAAAGRAELAWLRGQPTSDLVEETYRLAVRLGHGWAIGELGQWREHPAASPAAAAPYRLAPLQAARAWDELGCPYEAALALAGTGLPDELADALRRLERLGARPAADLVAGRLRSLGVRPARRSTLAHPDGLTAREADVLGLLREGLSNAQIAGRLHISAKTVDHHVSAILAKLGVRTRQEAARYGESAGPR